MKKLIVSSMTMLFFVLMFSGTIISQPDHDQKVRRERIHEKLDLTDEQQNKMQTLRTGHQKQMIDLKAELEKAQIDAKSSRSKGNLTRSDVISSVEKINKLKNELSLAAANHRMDMYEILTPEQREIWKEIPKMGFNGKGDFKRHKNFDGERMKMKMKRQIDW